MGANNHYKAQVFIDAIPGTGGIITKIADLVGCSWHTAKKYIDTYPTVQTAYQNERESVLDTAESIIINKLDADDEQMAKWYLTMKGAGRGYSSKQKIQHSGEGDDGEIVYKFVSNVDRDKLK